MIAPDFITFCFIPKTCGERQLTASVEQKWSLQAKLWEIGQTLGLVSCVLFCIFSPGDSCRDVLLWMTFMFVVNITECVPNSNLCLFTSWRCWYRTLSFQGSVTMSGFWGSHYTKETFIFYFFKLVTFKFQFQNDASRASHRYFDLVVRRRWLCFVLRWCQSSVWCAVQWALLHCCAVPMPAKQRLSVSA